ncbi:MAG: glycosyltransferase [Actinomycetota bacterium]
MAEAIAAVAAKVHEALPHWSPELTPRLLQQAAQGGLHLGVPAMVTWLSLAVCDMPGASAALQQWRRALAAMPPDERDALPRLLRRRDHLAAEILQEARLAPDAAAAAREALADANREQALENLAANPGSYPAAVAVVTLAPRQGSSTSRAATQEIPRILVQGWFDSPMPDDVLDLTRSWAHHHPDWEHRLFDTASASAWIDDHLGAVATRTFLSAPPVGKSNLFRYAYLSLIGGVWSDADDRAIACIAPLTRGRSFVMMQESIGAIADNFLAVAPGHPVLAATRDEAFHNAGDGFGESQWLANGPGVLTRHVAAWLTVGRPDIDYVIASGSELSKFVAMHEPLAYKETDQAWDVPSDANDLAAEHWLHPWQSPVPLSQRQRALLDASGPTALEKAPPSRWPRGRAGRAAGRPRAT